MEQVVVKFTVFPSFTKRLSWFVEFSFELRLTPFSNEFKYFAFSFAPFPCIHLTWICRSWFSTMPSPTTTQFSLSTTSVEVGVVPCVCVCVASTIETPYNFWFRRFKCDCEWFSFLPYPTWLKLKKLLPRNVYAQIEWDNRNTADAERTQKFDSICEWNVNLWKNCAHKKYTKLVDNRNHSVFRGLGGFSPIATHSPSLAASALSGNELYFG